MIVWIDLETTGLDVTKDVVLEVAAIITDDALVEIARFSEVCHWQLARGLLDGYTCNIDPYVVKMHTDNGLWLASSEATARRLTVDEWLETFIVKHVEAVGKKLGPQLGGSTINFDRAFLKAQFPLTHSTLHYRNVDVTTLNELARRFWPAVHAARPRNASAAHRAAADVEESLNLARYYTQALGPMLNKDQTLCA